MKRSNSDLVVIPGGLTTVVHAIGDCLNKPLRVIFVNCGVNGSWMEKKHSQKVEIYSNSEDEDKLS